MSSLRGGEKTAQLLSALLTFLLGEVVIDAKDLHRQLDISWEFDKSFLILRFGKTHMHQLLEA